jgi:hypothetical protein
MKREFWITAVVIVLLLGSVVLKFFWEKNHLPQTVDTVSRKQTTANPGYADIAQFIASEINELSPSPSFDNTGWLAQKISFSSSAPLAYVAYTDTHVLLRLLLEYNLSDRKVQTKVLATFLPTPEKGWQLQFGSDAAAGQKLIDYVYNGDSKQWIPQELISK